MTVFVAPLLFFLLLELVLRLAGFGYPTSFFLRTHVEGKSVRIENDRFGWRFFGPELARTPQLFSFSEEKPPGTIRVFVFGESAALGVPQPEFGLSRMLEALLTARYPGVRFEVIDTAMTAINSHTILCIARECARMNGDIWVIYMGNNEVVGPFGAGTVFGPKIPPLFLIRCSLAIQETRTAQCLESLLDALKPPPPSMTQWRGMAMFLHNQVRLDDPRMTVVYSHFQRNLDAILDLGLQHGAKIVLSTVGCNLRNCAPFASSHQPGLPPGDLARWNGLYQSITNALDSGDLPAALAACRQAATIDDSYADLLYRWGRLCLASGQVEEAAQHLAAARDQDTLRFRADSRINEIIRRTARRRASEGVALADGERALALNSPHGLPGEELFYEHVHLTFEGNYCLATDITAQVATLLPRTVIARATGNPAWPSIDDCARRLGWSDWTRFQAESNILERLDDPPFTMQSDHGRQVEYLRHEIEQCLPAGEEQARTAAEASYRGAIALAPQDWYLYRLLAELQQDSGDPAGAAESWRQVTQLMPHCQEAWEGMGNALLSLGKADEALPALNEALRLHPGAVAVLFSLGQLYAAQGKGDLAVECYHRVLALRPERSVKLRPLGSLTHWRLAEVLDAQGKSEAAKAQFRKALSQPDNAWSTLSTLGQLCLARGWYREAADQFEAAIQLRPGDARLHLNLAVSLEKLERAAEAGQQYAEAIRLDPNLAEAHFQFGLMLGREKKFLQAGEQFAQTVRLSPGWLQARIDLGAALMMQHRDAEARREFEEVLRRDPGNQRALQHLRVLESQPPASPGG
jgi:tetratricopeptide (TPR) repeat protein